MPERLANIESGAIKPESAKVEHYQIDGYDIIIEEPEEKSGAAAKAANDEIAEIKSLLHEVLNPPKLIVLDSEGQPVTGDQFNSLRSSIWENESPDEKTKKLIGAFQQNYLTFSRIHQISNLLELLPKDPESDQVKMAYHRLVDPVDKYAYKSYTVEEKQRFMDQIHQMLSRSLN